jgi:hypothetical protein
MLKLSIDDSKIVKIILATVKDIQKSQNNFHEIRGESLDISLRRIISNIEKVEEILDNFLLKGKGKLKNLRNLLFNDTFGSLKQFKIELENRFNCNEIKLNTKDGKIIDW